MRGRSLEELARLAEEAASDDFGLRRLAAQLGPWARYLLTDKACARLSGIRRTLREELRLFDRAEATAFPIFVLDHPAWGRSQEAGVVRRATTIPLRWSCGVPDDSRLSPALIAFAETVRADSDVPGWGLGISDPDERFDLSRLELGVESAWASLAAALRAAALEGPCDRRVMATAAFKRGSDLGSVDRIPEKVAFAAELGARTLFVSRADLEVARQCLPTDASGDGLQIRELGRGSVREILSPLLGELLVPPPKDAPLDEQLRHWERVVLVSEVRAEVFYFDRLLPMLLRRTAAEWIRATDTQGRAARVDTLFTASTRSGEVLLFALESLQPSRVVVLQPEGDVLAGPTASDERRSAAERAVRTTMAAAERRGADVRYVRLGRGMDAARLVVREAVAKFANGVVGFDATPGPKDWTLALAAELKTRSARCFYLETEQRGGRPRPGTERLREFEL